ncbi:hypothetical protein [Streptomyces sp. A0592]|uniref:hypothetical protein n=1 Tax=Streptomyces sp. A0592 TaxID=2563099 RepID=UPI0014470249|nr:hypothetical protein [Streptomyces sp. A0592]
MLFRTLLSAGRRWSYTRKPDSTALGGLVLVLCCDPAAVPSLRERLQSCWEELITTPA